jgi:hypothetical protein
VTIRKTRRRLYDSGHHLPGWGHFITVFCDRCGVHTSVAEAEDQGWEVYANGVLNGHLYTGICPDCNQVSVLEWIKDALFPDTEEPVYASRLDPEDEDEPEDDL